MYDGLGCIFFLESPQSSSNTSVYIYSRIYGRTGLSGRIFQGIIVSSLNTLKPPPDRPKTVFAILEMIRYIRTFFIKPSNPCKKP